MELSRPTAKIKKNTVCNAACFDFSENQKMHHSVGLMLYLPLSGAIELLLDDSTLASQCLSGKIADLKAKCKALFSLFFMLVSSTSYTFKSDIMLF